MYLLAGTEHKEMTLVLWIGFMIWYFASHRIFVISNTCVKLWLCMYNKSKWYANSLSCVWFGTVHCPMSFNDASYEWPKYRESTVGDTSKWIKRLSMFDNHYNNVIMRTMASQITSIGIAYSTLYSGADQRKHQSSAWLAFVRRLHRWRVKSPHNGPVMGKIFPLDVIVSVCMHFLYINSFIP